MTTRDAGGWGAVPLGPGVRVLNAHRCGLAALAKPAGVLSHPNRAGEEGRSLVDAAYDTDGECFHWTDGAGAAKRVWLLHRLDSATSGVLLVASSAAVATAVREAFEHRQVKKTYLAIVLGHPRERHAVWRDAMQVARRGGTVRAAGDGALRAETTVRCLKRLPGPPALAALELEPHTGRTHQLRHQCAEHHLPILGDQNYGNFRLNREFARRLGTGRLFLHAQRVAVEFALDGTSIAFAAEAPPPEEFSPFVGRR